MVGILKYRAMEVKYTLSISKETFRRIRHRCEYLLSVWQ
jgi:hypothetical protein